MLMNLNGIGRRRGRGAIPPALLAELVNGLVLTRTDGSSGAIRATVKIPCLDDAACNPDHLQILNGSTELAILTPVVQGTYASGRPRTLYTEVDTSGATGTLTLSARFIGPRTVTPLATRTYGSFEDPVSHLLPLAQMTDARKLGHAPAFFLLTSATYLCGCGAFGPYLPVADEAALSLGTDLDDYNADFNTFMRDYHWEDNGQGTAFLQANITNTAYNGVTDLSDPSDGYPGWVWGNDMITGLPDQPPGYRIWREAVGLVSYSGGHNYYGADRIHFVRYLRTGNPEYFIRGCAYAEACRHYSRWTKGGNASAAYVQGVGSEPGTWQIEGFGLAYLLTGNPDMLTQLRRQVQWMESVQVTGIPAAMGALGDYQTNMGEPRAIGRIIDGYNWLVICEDLANVATWAANLEVRLDQAVNGSAWTHWTNPTDFPLEYHTWAAENGGAPTYHGLSDPANYKETVNGVAFNDGDHPGVNEFMNAILRYSIRQAVDMNGGHLSPGLRDDVLARISENVARLWAYHFEGWPEQFTGVRTDAEVRRPSFYNGFSDPDVIFPDDYSLTPDLNLLYVDSIAWLAAQQNDGALATMARRLFSWGVQGSLFNQGLAVSGNHLAKQCRESYCHSQAMFYWLAQGPVATTPAGDAITQITIQDSTPTLVDSLTLDAGASADTSLTAVARDAVRLPRSASGLTADTDDHAVATASVNTTTGVLTITPVGGGTCTVTVSNTSPAVSNSTLDVTVNVVSTDLLDTPTNWVDQSVSPASAVVSGGQAHLIGAADGSGHPGISLSANAYNLDAAGANGIQIKITAINLECFFAIRDNTGAGYAFHARSFSNIESGTWNDGTFAFTGDGAWNIPSVVPVWYRFAVNGANLEMSTSTDGVTWSVRIAVAKSSYITTAMKIRLFCFGFGDSATVDSVTVG
jgi:hypothetical protein